MEAEDERAAEAQREKEAGNDAYRKLFLETAVLHYTRGAALDPRDISFLTNRAAAYLLMSKYKECVRDCDDAVERGRELRADNRLLARALSRKASALLKLAACAGDYAPAIRALQQSLAEHYSLETLAKLDEAESGRKEIEEQERLDQEAADHHRHKGNEFFQKKKYQEAADHYTEAIKKNPNDPRVFSNRAQSHIYLRNLSEGLEDAEKCIELDPTFLKGYLRKANAQFLMDDYESALATYIEGLKCDPNSLGAIDGLRRCAACIKRSDGGDFGPEDLKEILGDLRSDNDLRNKLKKTMEEVAVFKQEASDERLRRIESERMARTSENLYLNQVQQRKETEEFLSKIQEELQQLKVRQDEVIEELQKANEHNESLQHQISESKDHYDWLLSEHDHLLHERNRSVREVEELRQRRGQILSVLVTAMHCEFSPSELERATENFSSLRKIGEGGFGCVYQGVLRNMTVAIKVLRPDGLQGQSQFEQEVTILSRVRHPNLVTLLGACSELSTLVYEFLPNGSLEDFLVCQDKRATLTWQIRVRIIAEICSALIFLHENKPHPIVHADLKPSNILLDVNLVSKLSDFGISRLLIQSSNDNTTMYRTMHPLGTPAYMDPEFLATGEMTPRSDVYSFGIIVMRLLTGKPPVGVKRIVEDAMMQGNLNSVIDTSAGEWPAVHVQQLAHLALGCTEPSRRCRPDLSGELWRALESMRDDATSSSPSSSRSVLDESSIPSYFICPISQDVMNDPHIAADGFTYEGDLIRSWLNTGSDTSPMTNLPLEHDELIPNLALRSAIQEWHQQKNTVPQ
ncbi:U-box domain-containing protein 70-like isoform X1 [Lolium rigidum]|uniref:U-box domain-containing protein 70-like isoform X1 n=1 Tax=Lolium rigidum TaxID=89674 RepID=UPI001F5CFCFE|nr:U-box domain-containing protein 70-like isoform X1 [Lolium rigidum]